jgi:hypothetical protein
MLLLGIQGPQPRVASGLAQFPLTNFHEFEIQLPALDNTAALYFDTTPEPLAIAVRYTGRIRSLPEDKSAFMELCNRAGDGSYRDFFRLYRQEIEVCAGLRCYWIPIQMDVARHLRKEAAKSETILIFVRYFGWNRDEPVYFMIDYLQEEDIRQ